MRTSPYNPMDLNPRENEPEYIPTIILEKYEHCSFCHSKLVFSHDLNMQYLQVIETSRCPGCGVSANAKKFTLQ